MRACTARVYVRVSTNTEPVILADKVRSVWQEGWEFQKANRVQGRRLSGAELTELDRVFCALEEG